MMAERAGLVAVVGAPNAGKSTLVNALVGQKVAIVSPKAQTTRARLMGIAILGSSQILLVDTPGIFQPKRRLDRAMVAAACVQRVANVRGAAAMDYSIGAAMLWQCRFTEAAERLHGALTGFERCGDGHGQALVQVCDVADADAVERD